MSMAVLRFRIDAESAEAVRALAEMHGLSVSAVLRLIVQHVLTNDERIEGVLAVGHEDALDDQRTPQQAAAWERDVSQLTALQAGLLAENNRA
jgi:hypothetical protein